MNICKCEIFSAQAAIIFRMTRFTSYNTLPHSFSLALAVLLCALFAALAPQTHATQSVTLAWDANSEPDIAGYTVRYGTASGNYTLSSDAGSATTATISNLTDGLTYFIAVTARNSAGLESLPSQEVSFSTVGNQTPVVNLTSPAAGGQFVAPANIAPVTQPKPH